VDGRVAIIDFDQSRSDVVGAEFAFAPRQQPGAMVDGFAEVVPLTRGFRDHLPPLSWIAVLDRMRRQVQFPTEPLPGRFLTEQRFLAQTPRDAYLERST
jgi:Ser/Thr protein kinase RdoA (MazF antagonist)